MAAPAELRLAELARAARESGVLAASAPAPEPSAPDSGPDSPVAFDDEVLLWALASSTCGGLDACIGSGAEC